MTYLIPEPCRGCGGRLHNADHACCLRCWMRVPQSLRIDLSICEPGRGAWVMARAGVRGWLAAHPADQPANEPATVMA